MNVRTLCLAILYFGETTGYDIKKLSMEGKYSHFVDASFGSIYPALSKLEKEGLVTCRQEAQDGKPPRKIYAITESGRTAFRTELMEPPGPNVFRSEFLLISMCAEIIGPEQTARAIDTHIGHLMAELDHLKKIRAETEGAAAHWTCEYGIHCISAGLDYARNNRSALIDIAAQTSLQNAAQ